MDKTKQRLFFNKMNLMFTVNVMFKFISRFRSKYSTVETSKVPLLEHKLEYNFGFVSS